LKLETQFVREAGSTKITDKAHVHVDWFAN